MSRTVDTSSTFENWRQNYNDLANDVGGLANLTTPNKSSVVNAINYIMDQYFFFQDFDYDGSDGATSNTVFSGNDNNGNALQYSSGRVLVYKNGLLLRSGTDYTATNGTSITLASSASNSDVIRISSFTGSYQGVGGAGDSTGDSQFLLAGGVLYNKNTGGVVLNADSSITNNVTTASTIQLEGNTHINGHFNVNSIGSDQKDIRFWDDSNSNYVALRASGSISSNVAFTLPTADGSAGQFLKTDGSGNFSFDTVSSTAPDITISANNSTDETVFLTFVDGATGTQGLETDTGLNYNPSSGVLTTTQFTGALSGNASTATALASSRNIHGVAFDGTANIDLSEVIQDTVGAMFSSNTETGIAVTYEDGDGTIDLVVGSDVIVNSMIADDAIDSDQIVDNAVGATALNISGNGTSGQAVLSDGDGSFSYGSSGKTTEEIQDIVGAMFSSNTETRISATYEDGDGTIDLVVDDMTANTQLSDAQVRSKLSAGTGISYNNSTGVITNSSTNTDTLPVAGTGISVSGATVTNSGVTSIVAGSNVSISGATGAVTITSTDTNTTYSVGDGGLTQNNFTNTLKSKLDGIASGATVGYVSGNNVSFGTGTFSGAITSTGDITAFYSSDMALKENFSPISQALQKVGLISGYEFDWKDHKDPLVIGKGHDVGIIAQEVEKVLPEVVMTRTNGKKAVNYQKIIPLLIESIKELKTELDELKSSKI